MGRYGGPQIVSLQPPDDTGANCLGTDGRPIHELLHALGIFHEQSRADRDKFVKINFENVIPRMLFFCFFFYFFVNFFFFLFHQNIVPILINKV